MLHVVDHLHLGLVSLPLARVALDPRDFLIRVERVGVAILRYHSLSRQVRVQRVEVDALVHLDPVRDDARGFVVQVAHQGEDARSDAEPNNHGDDEPHEGFGHERVDDVRARPRGVHDGPLAGEPIENLEGERSGEDDLHDVQRGALTLVDLELLEHVAGVASNLLLQAEHLGLRDGVCHRAQAVHLVSRAQQHLLHVRDANVQVIEDGLHLEHLIQLVSGLVRGLGVDARVLLQRLLQIQQHLFEQDDVLGRLRERVSNARNAVGIALVLGDELTRRL